MESDGNIRTPGSAAYFFVGPSRVPCGPAVSGQLTIPVGRPVSNQDVSGPSLIVQMTPSRGQSQDHHGRATVVRTTNQPVTMHRFPLQLNHASANHILSPNQHFKQIPVFQRNTNSIQMESVRKNVFVSTPVASPQLPYSRVGLTPHMLMTYVPPRNRLSSNQRTRVVPVNRPNPMYRRDYCPSDDELLEVITENRPVYDAKNPAELIKVEHNYCFVPKVSPQRNNQVNGLAPTSNVTSGQTCIVSPTVSQTQYNVVTNNNRVIQKPLSNPNNVPISDLLPSIAKHEPQIQVESELSASDHDLDGQGEETDTAPEAVAEGKDNVKSEEPAVTRCICEMEHDDGFMISCDKCLVWQHVDCVLESRNNLPEEYLCERCSPRPFNKEAAAALQHMKLAKRISLSSAAPHLHSSDSDLSSEPDLMSIDRNSIQNKRKKYKSRQKNAPKRKPNGLPQVKQRRKSGPSPGSRKKGSMTPEKKALAEERKKMLIKRKEMLLEKKRLAAMDKKKKVNQEKKIIQKKKAIDYSSDDEPKILKAEKPTKQHNKSNVEQPVDVLRNWIDKYEEAVTNHYSQELRARLSSIKPNGSVAAGELRTPVKIPISRSKISLLPSGVKMLVSSSVLMNNQPIIEVRGKFTWTGSLAYKDPIPNRTDPYVFFYVVRFSTDCDIEVCVDCRTYGNDARFVRRSCKPNSELKHYVEKGSIHLYIVAKQYIEKNSEITISHQVAVSAKRCYCGDPLTCTASLSSVTVPPVTPPLNVIPESSSSSPLIDPTVSHSSDDENKPQRNKRTRQQRSLKKPTKKIIKRTVPNTESPPPTPVKIREPNGPGRPKSPIKNVETSPEPDNKSNNNDKIAKRLSEMSREERKMAAIMKAFERMEKKEARKPRPHKDSDSFNNSSPLNLNRNRVRKNVVKRKQRPSNKSSRSKATRANRPQRRAAAIASHPYNSSSDEDDNNNDDDDDDDDDDRKGRLLSRKRVQNRCKFSVRFQHRPSTQSSVPRSMLRRSPHNSLLNTPVKIDSEEASGSEGTPSAPLSNTCMLVAAAVGPLAPGFKFPNTKKDFVNSWVKSEGNSPTGSEDYKLGESGCAKKRWLQQAISEQDSVGAVNGDQQVGPLKKRRMARESMSECPSPTVAGSGQMSFADDDVIEDEEVEQASRNASSVDSKLAVFENKSMPLIDLQKTNTVALVESFLGEFKPDDENTPEKLNETMIAENLEKPVQSQPFKEPLNNDFQSPIKQENEASYEVKHNLPPTTNVSEPICNKPDIAVKETVEECIAPVEEKPPPPPVKRKLSLSEYRRRKESQATAAKEKETESGANNVTRPSPSVSPNTSLAAYEEITQQVIAKSLELESKLAQKTGPTLFETNVSKEEPKQWENLNDRLRRQFGVNITEDLPKRHPRLSPSSEFIPTPIESSRYSYYHRSENEQLYSCAKEDILLPATTVHDNGPPNLFSPPSQAYFSTMFFRQPPPPPPPPPPPV